jgi:hypothetical protein
VGFARAQELVPFSKNGKYGFKSGQEIVIQPKYDYALDFYSGLAAVKLSGKWGFINTEGELLIPNKYKSVSSFDHGYARFQHEALIGLLDTMGNIVLAPCADFIQYKETYGSEEQFELGLNGRRGLFVPADSVVVSPKYKYVNYRRGSCVVRLDNDKLGIVHDDNLKIKNLINTPYFSNKKIAKGKTADGYGLLSSRGVWLVEPKYKGMHVEMWGAIPLVMVSDKHELSSYRQKDFLLLDKNGSLVLSDTFVSFEKVYENGLMEYDWGTEPYSEVSFVFTNNKGEKYEPSFREGKLQLVRSHRLDLKGLPPNINTFYSKGMYGIIDSNDTLLLAEYDTLGTIILSSSNSEDYVEYDEWGEPLYSYDGGVAEYLWLKKGDKLGIYHLASKQVLGGFHEGELEYFDRYILLKSKGFEILYLNEKYFKGQNVELRSFFCSKFSSNRNQFFKANYGEVDYIFINGENQCAIYNLEGNELIKHPKYIEFKNNNVLLKEGVQKGSVNAFMISNLDRAVVEGVYPLNLLNYIDESDLINEYGDVIFPEFELEFFYKDARNKIGVLLSNGKHVRAQYDSIRVFSDKVSLFRNAKVDILYFKKYSSVLNDRILYFPAGLDPGEKLNFESDDYELWLVKYTDSGSIYYSSTGVQTSYINSELISKKTVNGVSLIESSPEGYWKGSVAAPPLPYKKIIPHWGSNYHLAKVKGEKGWGVNQIGGKEIVPAIYKKLYTIYDAFEEMIIHAVGSKSSALYKLNGDLIYEGDFKGVEFPYVDGIGLMEIETKNGLLLVDYETGQLISPSNIKSYEPIEAMLDDSEYFSFNGFIMTDKEGEHYLFNKGCFCDVCDTYKEIVRYDLDFLFFEVNEGGKEYIYSLASKYYYRVFEETKDYTIDLYGGVALMTSKTTGRFRVYDLTAGMLYEGVFDDFRDGAEGLEVFVNNKWQFVFELPLEE